MSDKIKVVMQVSIAGNSEPRYGLEDFSFHRGQIVAVHPDLARAWIASGKARAASGIEDKKPEVATIQPAETAVMPEAKPKRGRPPLGSFSAESEPPDKSEKPG